MTEPISDERVYILRHALGLTRAKVSSRNHFVTGPGTIHYPHCEALVAAGLMSKHEGSEISGGDPIYCVTTKGIAALKAAGVET